MRLHPLRQEARNLSSSAIRGKPSRAAINVDLKRYDDVTYIEASLDDMLSL
jgi:hypothetical protein